MKSPRIKMDVGVLLGERYELVGELGAGAMGEVWEARDNRTGERVAVKLLHPDLVGAESVTRFRREALAAKFAGRSEHIIKLLEIAELPEGIPYMVAEYLEGSDLRKIMDEEGPFDPARAASIAIQTCHALAELHGQGIVHRDVKPENIFVCDRGGVEYVKLLDFGVAKFRVSPDEDPRTLTDKGYTAGTPYYIAPERLDGSGWLDHRADIYSVGVILYELLTGRPPFEAPNVRDFVVDALTATPWTPQQLRPEIDEGLSSLVMKAMERKVEERVRAVDEFAAGLEPYRRGRSTCL